jgi:hypothetical protein
MVASRVLAAALGGYALTSAITLFLALVWPASRPTATASATMISFVVYTLVVIWAFATRTAARAWVGVVAGTAIFSALCWLLMRSAG